MGWSQSNTNTSDEIKPVVILGIQHSHLPLTLDLVGCLSRAI